MSKTQEKPRFDEYTRLVQEHELPLSCPNGNMELWNAHPKVYLPLAQSGDETCPYCGTRYVLKND